MALRKGRIEEVEFLRVERVGAMMGSVGGFVVIRMWEVRGLAAW